MSDKPFSLDLNLDDDTEREQFLDTHPTTDGRRLANKLGLKGPGSQMLATQLLSYAWNKHTAANCRLCGDIVRAQMYEATADYIYAHDIQPVCECW